MAMVETTMSENSEFASLVGLVREKKPLVHHITNYVTVNDCANITLAIGASPIMADAIEEAGDIAAISSAVVLNIGTLNARTVESMITAGRSANRKNIPVVFDPVGAGASALRNDATARILREIRIAVLRGNISEVRFVSGLSSNTKGVDASKDDAGDDAGEIARDLALRLGCVVAITGAVDSVSDGSRIIHIHNGHPALSSVTGTGCMCTSLTGSFCGAAPESILAATVSAVSCMGLAGEIAYENAGQDGNGGFHAAIIDAVSKMNENMLARRMKCREA